VAQETGGLAVPTDVADPDSVEAMARTVLEAYGRIDVLVNNAAIFSTLEMRPFDEIPLEEWDRVLRVNLTGAFLCARAVAGAMRKAGWGRIINIASGAVSLGRPYYLHYVASKSALVGMTNSLARELGGYGITVNAILRVRRSPRSRARPSPPSKRRQSSPCNPFPPRGARRPRRCGALFRLGCECLRHRPGVDGGRRRDA